MSDINQVLDQLKKNAMTAISQDRTDEGLLLLGYHDQLQAWQKNEFAGQAPVSVARLQEWGIEPPDDWPAAAANTTDGDGAAPEDPQADFSQELARAHRLLKQKNFSRARDLFDKIGREAAEETTRAEAEAYARQAEKERSAALAAIVAKAEEHDRKQAADLKGRLDKWQKVQKKAEETDPEFSVAREKIKEIENLEVVKKAEQQIDDLAGQLPKIKDELDLLGAKNVLLNVENLSKQYSDQPVLKSRLDDLLRQLNGDDFEQAILPYLKRTLGYGATEMNVKRWVEAYKFFRKLLDDGVRVALDPDDNEKPVKNLYREACEGLAKFITDKVGDRAGTAQQAFDELHNLELALSYSDEALAFVKELLPPQFPDDLRIQVESLRDAVQEARRPYELKLKDWQTAKEKFLEAVKSDDDNQALKFLKEVEVHWPEYPKLDEEREKRRHSLAGLLTRRLQNVCAEAEDLAERQKFEEAQQHLTKIREEASIFAYPDQSLKETLQQAQVVAKKVRERETRYKAYQKLVSQAEAALQEKPPGVQRAQSYLDRLQPDERDRSEAINLFVKLSGYQDASKNWTDAQAAYSARNYDQAMAFAKNIMGHDSPHQTEAERLYARSQAMKLYQENKPLQDTPGMVGRVKNAYQTIVTLLDQHGTDQTTGSILPDVQKSLAAIGDLEENDRLVGRELATIQAILERARITAGTIIKLTHIREWEQAYELVEKLIGTLTTRDKEVQDLARDIEQGWQEDVINQINGISRSDYDDYVSMATAWEMIAALEKYKLLPPQIQYQVKNIEKCYLELREEHLDVHADAEALLVGRKRLLVLADSAEKLSAQKRLRQAEIAVLCAESKRQVATDPDNAAELLKQKLSDTAFFGEPKLIEALIEVYLESRRYDQARETVEKIKHSPHYGQETEKNDVYQFWQSLIRSHQLFSIQRYRKGIVELEQLKQRVPDRSDDIDRQVQGLLVEAVDGLISQAGQHEIEGSPVDAIEKYSLALSLTKDSGGDIRATQGLEDLRGSATQAIERGHGRARNLKIGEGSLDQLIQEATDLHEQLEAMESVKKELKLSSNIESLLATALKTLETNLDTWQKIANAQKTYEDEVERALTETWDFQRARTAISQIQQLAANERVLLEEINRKQAFIRQANEFVQQLKQESDSLKKAISHEEFEEVIGFCRQVEQVWRKAKRFDNRFAGLEKAVDMYYGGMIQEEVNNLDRHQQIAQRQINNLALWEKWLAQIESTENQIINFLDTCQDQLEQGGARYAEIAVTARKAQSLCEELETQLERRPDDPLSDRAEGLEKTVDIQLYLQKKSDWQQEAIEIQQQCQEVETALHKRYVNPDLDIDCEYGLIACVNGFLNSRQPIPQNRELLKVYMEIIRSIAPYDPDVLALEESVKTWEKKPVPSTKKGWFGNIL